VTVLVTGGAGFIGSHLSAALLARGETVRVVDNLSTGLIGNVPAGAEFVNGDLTDAARALEVVSGCDVVLHQAALPSVPLSIAVPRASHDANINATFNVLMAARETGVKRVVYAASSSAYGHSPTLPKVETMPANPRSPYALQKHVGEVYCQLFTRRHRQSPTAARLPGGRSVRGRSVQDGRLGAGRLIVRRDAVP
jgi:UDP-glucose 4-epimerase